MPPALFSVMGMSLQTITFQRRIIPAASVQLMSASEPFPDPPLPAAASEPAASTPRLDGMRDLIKIVGQGGA